MGIKKISLFLDCGAPSIYNALMRKDGKGSGVHAGAHFKDRIHDDFSFIKTTEYKKYRDDYIIFIKKYQKYIDVYSNLDVINNPEATWENQQTIEAAGLKPIPVFHLGSDLKWLEMYLGLKYEYIALGGITPNPPSVVVPILDTLWGDLLTDKEGYPKCKVHGYAVTSPRLMIRYPWYSVDSTSWVMAARTGSIYMPQYKNNEWVYDEQPLIVTLSSKSPSKNKLGKHIDTLPFDIKEKIEEYFKLKGYKLGKSEFKWVPKSYTLNKNEKWADRSAIAKNKNEREVEIIIELGLCNDYTLRDELNIIYFLDIEKSIQKWPWAFKAKGIKRFEL